MFTNRIFTALIIVTLAAVGGLTLREAILTSAVGSELQEAERIQQSWAADTTRWEAMGEYYANQAAAQRVDSATRSYIAWGEALEAAGKLGESAATPTVDLSAYHLSERTLVDPKAGIAIYQLSERTLIPFRNLASFNLYQRSEWFGNMNLEEAQPYGLDSATRSYIAWGEALQAAGKLSDSGTCSNTTQENIFAGIDSNLDSATRSYIAWGLALQAKDDILACR